MPTRPTRYAAPHTKNRTKMNAASYPDARANPSLPTGAPTR